MVKKWPAKNNKKSNTYPSHCRVMSGYHAARMFRTLKGNNWKKTATLVHHILFCFLYYNCSFFSPIFLDGLILPGNCIWYWILPQLFHLGSAFLRGSSLHDHAHPSLHVVRYLLPSHLRWVLLWIPEAALWASRENQPDSKTDTGASLVSSPILCVSLFFSL